MDETKKASYSPLIERKSTKDCGKGSCDEPPRGCPVGMLGWKDAVKCVDISDAGMRNGFDIGRRNALFEDQA